MIPSLPEEAIQRDVSRHIGENLSNYFFLSKYKLIFLRFKFTSIEVTIEVCPCKTVVHSVLLKFHTLIDLSQLPEATNVFS
jgi:hypothetical protein